MDILELKNVKAYKRREIINNSFKVLMQQAFAGNAGCIKKVVLLDSKGATIDDIVENEITLTESGTQPAKNRIYWNKSKKGAETTALADADKSILKDKAFIAQLRKRYPTKEVRKVLHELATASATDKAGKPITNWKRYAEAAIKNDKRKRTPVRKSKGYWE